MIGAEPHLDAQRAAARLERRRRLVEQHLQAHTRHLSLDYIVYYILIFYYSPSVLY